MLLFMGSGASLANYRRAARLESLNACAAACARLARRRLARAASESDGFSPEAGLIALSHDCEELCCLTARLLARGSELSPHAVRVCAEACRRCADACPGPDEDAIACSAACRLAEEACRRIIAVPAGTPA